MSLHRFKTTFRERITEWVISFGLLIWGIVTLLTPGYFLELQFFQPLLRIMSQEAWGLVAICLASIRLLFLGINGAWRPSAHIRALGAFFSSLIWSVLLMASLGTSPTVGVYLVLLALDVFSIWFAAGDAKLADLKARE